MPPFRTWVGLMRLPRSSKMRPVSRASDCSLVFDRLLIQLGLDGVEKRAIDNCGLFAFEDLTLEGDLSDIEAEGMPPRQVRPIRSETRATLVASIARGRRWLTELTSDATANAGTIAEREGCSVRKVNMTISLAFLAPDLVKAAIAGRLPHGMGVARLADLPAEWARQHQMLGLPSQ